MNKEVILAEWQQITDRLLTLILSFSPETFNQKATEASWSPAQIAEHLWKVDLSTAQALKSETIPTNRSPDQKIALIKEAMDSDTKRIAPEMVKPSGMEYEPRVIARKISEQREVVKGMIIALDLTEACRVYKHPSLGTMTRLEWVYFDIYHAERHMRQMQGLQNKTTEA
ncbi:MAG TPA: DinB family protein [Flavisolibacter sp.]|jgi:uncharacterized damage-inducible protein DinB|nr:DinB family protein [Flavisolibacter sp.]